MLENLIYTRKGIPMGKSFANTYLIMLVGMIIFNLIKQGIWCTLVFLLICAIYLAFIFLWETVEKQIRKVKQKKSK